MNARYTILAAALAVVCVVAAIIIVPAGSSGSTRPVQRALVDINDMPLESVDAIVLSRAGAEPLRFERDGETWNETKPLTHPMDPYSIRQLIAQAVQAQVLDEVTPGQGESTVDAAMLGFEPPLATITYESPNRNITLKLGRRGLGGRAYVQVQGDDAIYVIKGDLHERVVSIDPREWRDRSLFHNVSVELQRITYSAGDTKLIVERDRRQWKLVQPTPTRADTTAVEAYIANLAKAQLDGFILDSPDSLSRFGLDEGVGTIEIDTGNNAPVQRLRLGVEIGASTGERFALVEGRPTVVKLNRPTVQALFPAAESLIDPTGSGVLAADVKTVTIRSGETELVFERDLDKWTSPSHGNAPVSPAQVEELLRQLTELRAPAVSVEPYPMDRQVAMVSFSGFGGKPLDTVRIVKDPDSGNWGFENGDNVLRLFPASMKLRLAPADYGLVDVLP